VKLLLNLLAISFLFVACSSKNHFEPKEPQSDISLDIKPMSDEIQSFRLDSGVTLLDGTIIVDSTALENKLPEGFNLLNYNDNKVIAVNNHTLKVSDQTIDFSEEVVAASLRDNVLALIFIDNSIAMYDLNTKKIIFKDYYEHSFLNDIKISNPYFMDNIILYPTLDGKVIVVDIDTKKVIRNIVVSTKDDIKNIIFIGVVGDNFIAASSNKIIALGNGTIHSQDYSISSIITSKNNIYITTIDGQIIKLDNTLKEIASKKYKFAKFFGLVYTDGFVYALESEGYIVSIDDNFTKDAIYEFDFDNEKYAIAIKNTFYFEDKYLEIK
jgi:hypothetical protein